MEKLDEKSLYNDFKLTCSSYLSAEYLSKSTWGALFSEDLATADSVVIIGLSLDYDLDIKRLIYSGDATHKIVFIEAPAISEDKKRKLKRFGEVYPIGLTEFIRQFNEYKSTSKKIKPSYYTYKAFNKYVHTYGVKKATALDINNLFIYGDYSDCDNLWYKEKGKYVNLVFRHELRDIDTKIKSGIRLLYIHANLGNGKTFFVEMLKAQMHADGFKIFTLTEGYESIIATEVKKIVEESGKKAVVIENYYNYTSVIKEFSLYDVHDIIFILTSRTVLYNTRVVEVNDMLGVLIGESYEINLNHLSKREIKKLVDILDNNGLWGEKSSLSSYEKQKQLADKKIGNSQFQSILFGILQSKDIKSRFEIVVNEINQLGTNYYQVIVLALLVKTMSLNMNVDDIGRILNVNVAFDSNFINDKNVQEILDFSSGFAAYKVKSSITAKMILTELKTNDTIIQVLIKTAKYADQFSAFEKYQNILKNIVSYSHVKTFLKRNRAIDVLLEYYDRLKEIDYYKENSFFWLQYAMACMANKHYDLAQNYIDNAYSYFKTTPLSIPFQIDTQQARLLLKCIEDDKSSSIKDDFLKAHTLLMSPTVSIKDNPMKQLSIFAFYNHVNLKRRMISIGGEDYYRNACSDGFNKINDYLKNKNIGVEDKKTLITLRDSLLKNSLHS